MDKKFDILSNPNIKLTEDGGAKPYKHTKSSDGFVDDIFFTNPDAVEIIDGIDEG